MKKLMVMLGAVAMAFGLFADATNYKTSFEANEPGVGTGTYDPDAAGWTGITEAMTLGAYAGDAYAYPVDEVAGNTRRDDFPQFDAQNNFLTLDTGADSLDRAITKGEKDIFIDQLVKFTGFEDPQTNVVEGTKIAVWMSEFVIDDETEATETNLYVTVGSEYATDPVAVKIIGDYELGKWYRITIKSIGDVFGGNAETARSGFLVFIDGKPATIDTTVTGYVALISQTDKLSGAAAAAYENDQLFPAITEGGEMLAGVGYKGVGAIDDVYIDELGPEFARFVDVTAADLDITGAQVTLVTQGGVTIPLVSGKYTVKPGEKIVVTYDPNGPYVIKGNGYATYNVAADGSVTKIDAESDIEVVDAVAKITDDETKEIFVAEFELLEKVAQVQNGDTITILKDCVVTNGIEEINFYEFANGTTIDVEAIPDGSRWTIVSGGNITDNVGVEPEKQVIVTFKEDGYMVLKGNIGGAGRIGAVLDVAGNVSLGDDITVGAGATLKAASITDNYMYITLGEGAKVVTETAIAEYQKVFTNEDVTEKFVDNAYVYEVEAAPTTFMVTATPAAAEEYITQFKIDDGAFGPYTEPVEAEIGSTVTIKYIANDGWRITAGDEVEKKETATVDAPTVAQVFTISTTGGANADVVRAPADGKGIAGETVTITATAHETFTYDGVTLGEGWAYVDDDKTNIVKTVTISDDETITVPGAVAKAAPVEPDPTKDEPKDIPADKTATEYFPNVSKEIADTGILAKDLATWCQGAAAGTVAAGGSDIKLDAYKLDCANTTEAINAAKEDFKFTAEDLATVMAGGTLTTLNEQSINGTLVITKWADPAFKVEWKTGDAACFYKAEITVPAKQ